MPLESISTVQEAVDAGLRYAKNWWRGQPSSYKQLIPKIFRENYFNKLQQIASPYVESDIIHKFKRLAPTLESSLPKHDDYLSWMVLMQHHGAPTRLLDWTDNVLVALFFACQSDQGDGLLWSLYPQHLNKQAGVGEVFPLENAPILKFLSNEPFCQDKSQYANELDFAEVPQSPVAFYPTLKFNRMNSQQSTFTIHPTPTINKGMTDILADPKHLKRYIVRTDKKSKLLHELSVIGINHRNLFNDLDSLAKDLCVEYADNPLERIWTQPE